MNTKTEFNDCNALPEVAMPFMNTVHCEELTLVAGLLAKVKAQAPTEEIDAVLAEWVTHTEEHFAREERLMEEYRFPPFPIHQSEHMQALDSLRSAQKNWQDSREADALANYIEVDWREWLQQHVGTLDLVTANFLSQFGIEVDL